MKLKSHKGMKKRAKISAGGKIMFSKPHRRHLLINKSKRQKRLTHGLISANRTEISRVKHLLPMSF